MPPLPLAPPPLLGAWSGRETSAKLPLLLSLAPFAAESSNLESVLSPAAIDVGVASGDSPKLPLPMPLPLGLPLPLPPDQLPLPKLPHPSPLPSAAAEGAASSELPSADAEEPPEGASAADAATEGVPLLLAASCSSLLALLCSLLFFEKGTYPETDARSGGWTRRVSAAAETTRATAPATAAPAATACCFCLFAAAAASASPRRPDGGGEGVAEGGGVVVAGGGGEGVAEGGGVVVAGGVVAGGGGEGVAEGGGVVVAGGVVAGGGGEGVAEGGGVVVAGGGGEGVAEGGGLVVAGGVVAGGVIVGAARKTTVATSVPGLGPLAPPNEVTTALSGPSAVGGVESATSSLVVVAAVTVPAAPLEKVTVFAAGELASNPEPEMTSSGGGSPGLAGLETDRSAALSATEGGATIEAIWTAAPLLPPNDVTTAVRVPRLGGVENASVREVAVAALTEKTPLLRTTELLAGDVASKFEPEMRIEGAFPASGAEVDVTAGAATTVATCTGFPLLARPKEVTETTDSGPKGSGAEKVTVSDVAFADETVFATAGLKATAFPAA